MPRISFEHDYGNGAGTFTPDGKADSLVVTAHIPLDREDGRKLRLEEAAKVFARQNQIAEDKVVFVQGVLHADRP